MKPRAEGGGRRNESRGGHAVVLASTYRRKSPSSIPTAKACRYKLPWGPWSPSWEVSVPCLPMRTSALSPPPNRCAATKASSR